jgi:UDP-glucose 4-epimerase
MTILVLGGAGYIGSHTCVQLLQAGYDIVVADNLSNSSPESLNRIKAITGKSFAFVKMDICDEVAMKQLFEDYTIDAVIHFAGMKAVGESTEQPLRYFKNNVNGSLVVLDAMSKANVKTIVFSSSATVYGDAEQMPVKEDSPLFVTNPYGRTKLMIEDILRDLKQSDDEWRIGILRYFNPIGAHESGLIGEDPNGVPNNLLPFVAQVAVGRLEKLNVFGNDYPTHDGTGIRDYIHVTDLADGHLAALKYLFEHQALITVNLGTGIGYSVLDVVIAFGEVVGRDIPYKILPRRAGDVAVTYADTQYAKQLIGWEAKRDLKCMCEDVWRWQSNNPNGFA